MKLRQFRNAKKSSKNLEYLPQLFRCLVRDSQREGVWFCYLDVSFHTLCCRIGWPINRMSYSWRRLSLPPNAIKPRFSYFWLQRLLQSQRKSEWIWSASQSTLPLRSLLGKGEHWHNYTPPSTFCFGRRSWWSTTKMEDLGRRSPCTLYAINLFAALCGTACDLWHRSNCFHWTCTAHWRIRFRYVFFCLDR